MEEIKDEEISNNWGFIFTGTINRKKQKSMGIETHVFAWAGRHVGEKSADYFYPVNIVRR